MANNEQTIAAQLKKMNLLKTRREKVFSQAQRSYDTILPLTEENIMRFKPRYDKLDDLETLMDEIQNEILQLNVELVDSTHALDVIQVQNSFDDLIFGIRGRFLDLTKNIPTNSTQGSINNVAVTSSGDSHLPPISIPTFSGRIEEWSTFYSLFNSVVHNNKSLSNAEKFHFLHSFLRGDALAVISNFLLTSENYPLAYDALQLRYQNKRRLASHYLNQIRDFTPATNANHTNLRNFLNVHSNSVSALKALGLQDLADFLLFQLSFWNLDCNTRKAFENKQQTNSIPSYQSLIDFVTEQNRTYELLLQDTKPKVKPAATGIKTTSFLSNVNNASSHSHSGVYCPLCKGQHALTNCNEFLQKNVEQKYDVLRKLKRCFNCMGAHSRTECLSKNTCRSCRSNRHHSLLHQESSTTTKSVPNKTAEQDSTPTAVETNPTTSSIVLSCQSSDPAPTVLLATVQFLMQDINGYYHSIRAVVDPGSQTCAITSSLTQQLQLKRMKSPFEITGISNTSVKTQGLVQCLLRSKDNAEHDVTVHAVVLSNIPNKFPSQPVSAELRHRFDNLQLADDNFHIPSRVDFLIGADLYPHILRNSDPNIIQGTPSAINTIFGWIIMGPTSSLNPTNPSQTLLTCVEPIDRTLQKFWMTEEINDDVHISNPDDDYCEKHFLQTHYRTSTGRYVVTMPFRNQMTSLNNNRKIALRSCLTLEKRLSSQPQLSIAYARFLQEYLDLGHMQSASQPSTYVLPHHCVEKRDSTKIRVVFNGSFPDSNGVSLNQQLLPGPKLQKDLSHILMNFRFHAVSLTCDVKMMYREILLNPDQRYLQHIFWRPHPGSDVVEYELNTVTYGLTPSAFLAQRVLIQLVQDEGHDFPLAAAALTDSTYVDDVVTGASSVEQAKLLQSELTQLLHRGGFQLRKWASNRPEILINIPEAHLEAPLCFSDHDYGIKILGLIWDPKSDSFAYNVQDFDSIVTKRTVLSYIARTFDPMGWLSPLVFWTKQFLQQIWIAKLDWDEPLTPSLTSQWEKFISQIRILAVLRIPRRIIHLDCLIRLVGFCDASERGFAAAVFLHVTHTDGNFSSYLLKAKSKVAPLTVLSIPRLELCGALLLSRLVQDVSTCLKHLTFESVYLYTDSTIVLTWINTSPHSLKTFVANRIVRILELTTIEQWGHVSSQDNPADHASRGMYPAEILTCEVWWQGAHFLKSSPASWPSEKITINSDNAEILELKPNNMILQIQASDNHLNGIISKFSSLTRLQRTFAYVLRFLNSLKSPQRGPLSTQELKDAIHLCVRLTQRQFFSNLYEELQEKRFTNSSLRKLSPFLDSAGLIRVGGRLRHSSLSYDSKHPLLLPKKCHLSTLICDYYHLYSLHSGPTTVQALIQQRFWILSARTLIRKRIFKCIPCFKLKSSPSQPFMADLPQSRVQLSRPFTSVGLDFAGPFIIKESRRRKALTHKGYLCLFVCMATKALHLEMVTELSTKAFMASLHRFTSRRGLPSRIFSDCGRNFLGASRQLQEISNFLKQHSDELFTSLATMEIEWHYNPPYAPNFGGLWEAGVKSAKNLLHRLIGNSPLTFEEYSTIFCRIESVLNSRPLCAVAASPEDSTTYLSPGHFLIGAALLQSPEDIVDENLTYSCRWQRLKQIYQMFWKRWSTEYLHTQLQRHKWTVGNPNLEKGAVVLLRDIATSPLSWPIGRVEEVHPGPDGVVRVATIKLSSGRYTRPVNKLAVLPIV